MKIRFKHITIIIFWLLGITTYAQKLRLHNLSFKTNSEMLQYFSYKANQPTILSGHRGGMTKGFPENSIETFENTLKHYPAFFEVDPRLTKDSVVVLMHDATLDRTTNGTGKLADYTYAEIQKLRLKDPEGNVTSAKIPTLKEAILWSKGKTVLNLDKKDVPPKMIVDIINECKNDLIMLTVHDAKQAEFYLKANPNWMLSAHILTQKSLDAYQAANVQWNRMIAYIGPKFTQENLRLLKTLNDQKVNCMISAAPSADKLPDSERAASYAEIVKQGANVLETDRPIEVGRAIKIK